MAFWPFSKAFGAGLTHGAVPTHSQLNQIDEQQAQAADGALWTDVAANANMLYPMGSGSPNDVHLAAWRELSGEWYVAGGGVGGVDPPVIRKAFPPYIQTDSFEAQTVPAGAGYANGGIGAFVCNPAGVLLLGGTPTTGTTQKLRRSVNGSTWTVEDTPSALGVKTLGWFPAAGLFLAGYNNTTTTIHTSPSGVSGTWTARTVPNSHERGEMAASPSRLVWAPSREGAFVNRDKVITTDDGITFTERSVTDDIYVGITYSTTLQKWFLLSYGGNVRWSSDGITWTAASVLPVASSSGITSYGRALYTVGNSATGGTGGAAEVWCSLDGAGTWRRISRWQLASPGTVDGLAIGPGGQLFVSGRLTGQARFGVRLGA